MSRQPNDNKYLDANKLGSIIKRHRQACGMTQKEFAESSGICQAAISHYERGNRIPEADILKRLSIALGVTLEEMSIACGLDSPPVEIKISYDEAVNAKRRAIEGLVARLWNSHISISAINNLSLFIEQVKHQ